MARVNLEERLFADVRLNRLGRMVLEADTNLKARAAAIGVLAILWRQSQDDKLYVATKSDFASWFDEDENGPALDTLLVELERAKYIVRDGDRYTISGNRAQLEAQERWAERAKKGGEANRKRIRTKTAKQPNELESLEKKGELKAELKLEHQANLKLEHQAEHKLSYTTQFNSTQFDSIEFDSIEFDSEKLINSLDEGQAPSSPDKETTTFLANPQKSEKPSKLKIAKEPTDGSKVWEAYSMAYQQRMGVEPIRNAKQNAICGQLVQRLGLENAIKVAVFYLSHPDAFYMRNKYPLGLLLKDCEGLYTEFQRGDYVTGDIAKKASYTEQTRSVVDRYLAKEGLKNGKN